MRPTGLLRTDRRGTAALEFALALPLLLAMMGGLADIGLLWRARGRLVVAVDAGAQYAVLAGTNATATNVRAAILAAPTLTPAPTVSVTAPACGCVSTTGGVTTLITQTCGTTCSGGGTASGSYMKLSATYTWQSILGLQSKITSKTFTEQATVRLQ